MGGRGLLSPVSFEHSDFINSSLLLVQQGQGSPQSIKSQLRQLGRVLCRTVPPGAGVDSRSLRAPPPSM